MTVGIGVIGAGGMAQTRFDILATDERAVVRGIYDVDTTRAEQAAARFGARPYADLDALLDDPSLDAIFVCVPPDAHGSPEIHAAKRGIDVFVEKPIALRTRDAMDILATIEESGVIAQVGHNWRYSTGFERAREILDKRPIGYLDGRWWGGVPGGPNYWWRERSRSGGQAIEQGIHVYDAMRYLAGDVERVWAAGGNRLVDIVDFPDVSSATMEHRSGIISHVTTSCAAQASTRGVEVIAAGATISISQGRLSGTVDGETIDMTFDTDPYQREVDAFLSAVSSGDRGRCRSPYRDAVRSLAVTEAATRSMDIGEPIFVDDLLKPD